MNILIANVGNPRVNEIKALAVALNKKHNVTIACMAVDSSYKGQAFSFQDAPVRVHPLLYKEIVKNANWVAAKDARELGNIQAKQKLSDFDNIAAFEFYSNPADAVSIMLGEIMVTKRPDIVICGINNGVHMGQDIYCSSNIGMAMEAGFSHVPAIAIAVENQIGGHSEEQLAPAVKFIEKNIEKLASLKLPNHTFLNINIPTVEKYSDFKGIKAARMSHLSQLSEYEEKTDPKGNKYYWAKKAESRNASDDESTARIWFDNGYITITPISYDATDNEAVDLWQKTVIENLKKEGI